MPRNKQGRIWSGPNARLRMYVIGACLDSKTGVGAGLDAGLGVVPGAIFAAGADRDRVGPVASNLIPHHHIVPEFQFAAVVIVPA